MVSTRGVRVKFSEGERVLCYEPDPTKAKVLYDSKVLQVVQSIDSTGRKLVEYLIHFQGWNASWDRRVTADFVLKDTDENRDLQKQLAEKAHIKLSIKSNRVLVGPGSYSKERRRRRLSETIRETIERERNNKEESDTSSQTGSSEDDINSLSSEMGSTTTGNGGEEEEEDNEEVSDEETFAKHIPFVLPDALKAVLEKDFSLINEKNKLVSLPPNKNIICVLEDYVRFFALRYVTRSREKRRTEAKEKERSYMTLELCKEVVDGIRICFDFYLHTLLLYPRERNQAEKLKKSVAVKVEKTNNINDAISPKNPKQKKEMEEEAKEKYNIKNEKEKLEKKVEVTPRRVLRSKRPVVEELGQTAPAITTTAPATAPPTTEPKEISHRLQQKSLSCESSCSTPTTLTSGGLSGQGTVNFSDAEMANLPMLHGAISYHLKNWTLLPEPYRNPPPPVLLYGPVHLLRLFVKMPEILYRMNLPCDRKKVILHHMELLLEYLNLHNQDFFSDSNYICYSEM